MASHLDICLNRGVQYETHKASVTQLTPGCCYVLIIIQLANINEVVDCSFEKFKCGKFDINMEKSLWNK